MSDCGKSGDRQRFTLEAFLIEAGPTLLRNHAAGLGAATPATSKPAFLQR